MQTMIKSQQLLKDLSNSSWKDPTLKQSTDKILLIPSFPKNSKVLWWPMTDSCSLKVLKSLDMPENSHKTLNFHSDLLLTFLHQKLSFLFLVSEELKLLKKNWLLDMTIKKTQSGNSTVLQKDVQLNGIKRSMMRLLCSENIKMVDLEHQLSFISLEVETSELETLHLSHHPLIIVLPDLTPTSNPVLQELKQTQQTSTTESIMMMSTAEASMTTQDPRPIRPDSEKSTITLILQSKLNPTKWTIK